MTQIIDAKTLGSARLEDQLQVPDHRADVLEPKSSRYLLVIPVINEGERIQCQLRSLHALGMELDVVIADGGSTDDSLDLSFLKEYGVRALLTKTGPGRLSAQLRVAYAWALAEGYDGTITVDGNGKDGLDAIPLFVKALDEGYDYIQGSRYRPGGEALNTPLDRKIGGRLLHAPLLSAASSNCLTDTTNGFRAYSHRYLTDPRVAIFRDCFSGYNLLFYLSVRAGQLGYRVTEIPVRRGYPKTGPVPTKMGSLASKVALVGELFRTAFGGYHPTADRPLSETGAAITQCGTKPWLQPYLLPLVFLLILASRVVGVFDAPDIWYDEGSLLANLPLPSLPAAFAPLPRYAQVAPPGYLILASAIMSLSGDSAEMGLRFLSIAASLSAAAFLALAHRRLGGDRIAPIALALVFLSPFGVRYGIEIKQYSFELLAACMVFYTTVRAVQGPHLANLAILGASGLSTILISFTAPLLLATSGLAAVMHLLLLGRGGIRPVGGVFSVLILLAGMYHLAVTSAATAEQFAAYSFFYDKAYLKLPIFGSQEGVSITNFLSIMLGMFDPFYRLSSVHFPQHAFTIISVLLLSLGLISSLRRGLLVPTACIALLSGIAVLSLVHLYPVMYTRYFIIVQPLVGIMLAIGLLTLFGWIARSISVTSQTSITLLVAGFILLLGGVSLQAGLSQEKQEISEALAVISSVSRNPDPLIYVATNAQPAMLSIAPKFGKQIGYGPHAFDGDPRKRGSTSTLAIDYQDQIRAHDEIWMLETMVDDNGLIELQRSLAPLEASFGPCKELFRSGSDPQMGYTLAFRCRATR